MKTIRLTDASYELIKEIASSKRYTNVEKFLEDYARGKIKWHIAVLKLNIAMTILSVKV